MRNMKVLVATVTAMAETLGPFGRTAGGEYFAERVTGYNLFFKQANRRIKGIQQFISENQITGTGEVQ